MLKLDIRDNTLFITGAEAEIDEFANRISSGFAGSSFIDKIHASIEFRDEMPDIHFMLNSIDVQVE